jgi:hypothetical protein
MRLEPSVGSTTPLPAADPLPVDPLPAADALPASALPAADPLPAVASGTATGPLPAAGPFPTLDPLPAAGSGSAAASGVLQRTQAGAPGGFRVKHVVQVIPSGTG